MLPRRSPFDAQALYSKEFAPFSSSMPPSAGRGRFRQRNPILLFDRPLGCKVHALFRCTPKDFYSFSALFRALPVAFGCHLRCEPFFNGPTSLLLFLRTPSGGGGGLPSVRLQPFDCRANLLVRLGTMRAQFLFSPPFFSLFLFSHDTTKRSSAS